MSELTMLTAVLKAGHFTDADIHAALTDADVSTKPVPTVKEFYNTVVEPAARSHSTKHTRGGGRFRTYEPYFKLLVLGYPYREPGVSQKYAGLGHKKVTDVTLSDLIEAGNWVKRRAEDDADTKNAVRIGKGRITRDYTQDGAYAHFFRAARFFYRLAVGDNLVAADKNWAMELERPKTNEGPRRPLDEAELAEVWKCVQTGGDDPELDTLLFMTVLITGCRREGLINLRIRDLKRKRATIWLREKSKPAVEHPATVALIDALLDFAYRRGATSPNDPVFAFKMTKRYPVRRGITNRRFDTIHTRIQTTIDWCDEAGFSTHWLRTHSVTQMRIISGSDAVASAFARHSATSVTHTYAKASKEEVLAAFNVMTGVIHPLTKGGW